MSFVRGKFGSYDAGSMIVFPWLKPKGQNRAALSAVVPVNRVQFMPSGPIPTRPCRSMNIFAIIACRRRQAMFIGFQVDVPYSPLEGRFDWFSNAKLADGKSVGIDWTSSNLNHPWFGGSRCIPNKDTCNGPAWRKLIVDGLMQASTGLC